MRNSRYSIIIVAMILLFSGCDDFLGDNIDPNKFALEDLAPSDLLPTSIYSTSQAHYSVAFAMCQYSQQLASYFSPGIDTQEETQISGGWSTIYLGSLADIKSLTILADRDNSVYYNGIAKILQATNLGLATDQWGDIPSSAATKGEEDFTPSYDSQEEVYSQINTLLDDAIMLLSGQDASGLNIGEDDLIYGGNASKWIRAAYALKARYAIHLTEIDQNQAVADALANIANAFQSNADDYQLMYNTRIFNPWHSGVALSNNTGNLSVLLSDQLVSLMDGTSFPFAAISVDPRLELISSINPVTETDYVGAVNGTGGAAAGGGSATADLGVDDFYSSQTAPLIMMSYSEQKFIEAEALFLQNGGTTTSVGTTASAYNAYLEGIAANMDKVGVAAADRDAYLADASVAVGEGNLTLALIMREKFIATFLNAESFVDLRRYDFDPDVFAGLELPANHNEALSGEWVRRAQYPSSEQTRNGSEVQQVMQAISVGVWWDAN
ncbi:MAG: SusD/RagB family nutrient-binding outer membrane lipoprotein [Sinomicrobium sp.]|nr:SusD/RagB family nutrient-binding outer membrane lipoprotein [Sinomicrobium sp.]